MRLASSAREAVPAIIAVSDPPALESYRDESWVPVLIPVSALSHVGQFLRVSLAGEVSEPLCAVSSGNRVSVLEERCQDLAESHGLSAREFEVLGCIARGRNAQYLEKRLGISLSTAKTHISHVYRKLGVSSQQALLDLVEQSGKGCVGASACRPSVTAPPAARASR